MPSHIVLRGLVYGVIWKPLHQMSLPEALALVAVIFVLFWIVGRGSASIRGLRW